MSATDGGLEKEDDIKDDEDSEILLERISDGLKARSKFYKLTKPFAEKTVVTRRDLLLLEGCVASYDSLKVKDKRLALDYQSWLSSCGKSVEDLENEKHKYRPSEFEPLLDQYCEVSDKVEEQFYKILSQYPNKAEVVASLSKFRKEPVPDLSINKELDDLDLKSVCSGRGAEYAKNKLPKIKEEISAELIKEEYKDMDSKRETDRGDLVDKLNRMFKILDVDGKFDKLLRELEEAEDISVEDAEDYEIWQKDYLVKIGNLRSKIQSRQKSAGNPPKNSSFQTFFKKLDPPKFTGDCLEFLEWKTKWKSVVSTCEQPAEFELDRIKENIPEQARKKLFDVHSLSKAWDILDRLYGDTKLISQKLKNKMKTLKPISTEPHEIIIEINEEVDYLVKRLETCSATGSLVTPIP